jgi:excisionase family DNA binding protein
LKIRGIGLDTGRIGVGNETRRYVKEQNGALKVGEIAKLLGVTPQHIYRMAASGSIPSFRVLGSVRFDPDEVAIWLQGKQTSIVNPRKIGSARVAA